jgi:hypothetical protein
MPEAELKDFAALVIKLRTAQKNFFKTREASYLIESKSLERLVDQRAEEIVNGKQEELTIL